MRTETRSLTPKEAKHNPSLTGPQGPERVPQARELIHGIVKTVRCYRIYAHKNPILKKFVDQLYQRLNLYLERYDTLHLGIGEFSFTFDGEIVYENESMTESLPFLMHRNGLRELWFDNGLTYRDLVEFLGAFRSYEILKDSCEDLVTVLWDKELSSIHFWATDDFLWSPVEIPEDIRQVIEKTEMPPGDQVQPDSETPLPQSLFKTEELEGVKGEIPREIEEIDYVNLLMILAEVVSRSGEDLRDWASVVDFFKIVLNRLLHLQDFGNLVKVLSFIKILNRDRRADANELAFVEQIVDYLSGPEGIEQLMVSLSRFECSDNGQLQKYLFLLSTKAIAPLCEAWLRMESAEGRILISSALVKLGREDIPALGQFLKDTRGQLVFNVVNILGKIGREECVKYIARVKGHANAKIRNEALHALSYLSSPDAKALLPTFLEDAETQIRISASKVLAEKLEKEALPFLGPLIRSREFCKRQMKERKAFLAHLGKIEEPESVRILEELLYRRVLFKRKQSREIKSRITSVLASMKRDEARVVLARWSKRQENPLFRLFF